MLMLKKSSLFRAFACLVLLSFSLTLMPAAALAAPGSQSAGPAAESAAGPNLTGLTSSPVLSAQYDMSSEDDIMVVAHATGDGHTSKGAEEVRQKSCCGDFWDVHFGGYRWAWWALAGAGLIAIHAN